MSLLQALILGALQGATEFLPVSSSGHLVIVPALLGWQSSLTFDVAVHWATTLAVLLYFRRDWIALLTGAWQGLRHEGAPWRRPEGAMLCGIALATVPAMLAGLVLEPYFEAALSGEPRSAARWSALLLLATGFILILGEQRAGRARRVERVGPGRALAIGVAQACAILPGISRSGTTIASGLALGLDRESAARFSFLLAAPIITGAAILRAFDLAASGLAPGEASSLVAGFVAAFVVGYLAIGWLLGYLRHASLRAFAVYCWCFGLLALALLA